MKGGQRKLTKLMIKQVLRLTQQMRDVEGALYDTVMIKSSAAEALEISRQTKACGDGVRAAGRSHQLGPPHIWAWGGLVSALCRRGVEVGGRNLEVLKAHLEELGTMSVQEKCETVRFCKLTKVFDANLRRITMAIPKAGLRTAVLGGLEQAGAERKLGRAPAGAMERELQAWIDGLADD